MERKHGSHEKRKKRNIKKINLIFMVIIIMTGFMIITNKTDEFKGIWFVDSITSFEFDGKGNGILKVPTDEYKFTYKIDKNQIYMNYEREEATDASYEYSFQEDKLNLEGIDETTGTYSFVKQK